jgi:hypothetical protein
MSEKWWKSNRDHIETQQGNFLMITWKNNKQSKRERLCRGMWNEKLHFASSWNINFFYSFIYFLASRKKKKHFISLVVSESLFNFKKYCATMTAFYNPNVRKCTQLQMPFMSLWAGLNFLLHQKIIKKILLRLFCLTAFFYYFIYFRKVTR